MALGKEERGGQDLRRRHAGFNSRSPLDLGPVCGTSYIQTGSDEFGEPRWIGKRVFSGDLQAFRWSMLKIP